MAQEFLKSCQQSATMEIESLPVFMSFQSLHHVLGIVEPQYQSIERQQLQQILDVWAVVVGEKIAAQTRPIALQRSVLQVATASPVWTQTLVFERPAILKKICDRTHISISDIRFSTAQWHRAEIQSIDPPDVDLWQSHPSRLPESTTETQLILISDPQTAFKQWATRIQQRSQNLPICPECGCGTPPGELDRWLICALCVSQKSNFDS